MARTGSSRLDRFHTGQVWQTGKGCLYLVVSAEHGKAVLRLGEDGRGRKQIRDWDANAGWVLHRDTTHLPNDG